MGPKVGLCLSCLVVCFLVSSGHVTVATELDVGYPATVHPETQISDRKLKEIFTKYGDGGQMTFEGFEHLLESLGLGNIIISDHDLMAHKEDDAFRNTHNTHNHSKEGAKAAFEIISLPLPGHEQQAPKTKDKGHSHDHVHDHGHDHSHSPKQSVKKPTKTDRTSAVTKIAPTVAHHDEGDEECLSAFGILSAYGIKPESSLNAISFQLLCPAIIYELDQRHCVKDHDHLEEGGQITPYQWLYATAAVVLISLCGLFSVAVIPIMQKWFYHTLLQFLVGLAVGSLSGDGLLHLMPHAMLFSGKGHSHGGLASESSEEVAVWRGLAALGGIFFFFIAERLLGAFTAYRRQKKEARAFEPSQMMIPVSSHIPNDDQSDMEVGEKLSHYRKNSYDIKLGADGKEGMQMLKQEPVTSRKSSIQSVHEVGFHGRASFSIEPDSPTTVVFSPNTDCTVTVSDHHGHGHGHSHEVPQSVSAVAWMVIMGDGLHNFCDGLAIGAAFGSSTEGGISTTIAVFCHELPHELGDFAMLLKTGMKVKQALFYNGLSSVLCMIGMVLGVFLGNIESATSWVFAATAGMFLYIALVDMLPELSTTSNDPGSTATYTLAMQVLGISIGISIMLLIAVYEPELKTLVS